MEVPTFSRYNIKTDTLTSAKVLSKNPRKWTQCHLQFAVCVTRYCWAALAQQSASAPQEELCVTVSHLQTCWCARGAAGCILPGWQRQPLVYRAALMKWHLCSSASIHFKALCEYSLMNSPGDPCWQSPLRHRCHLTSSPRKSSHTKRSPQFSNTLSMPLEQQIYRQIYSHLLYLSCW